MKLTLTNVRGFAGEHKFNIRPITVLIGENSSGKTTLLASIHAALNRDFPSAEKLFNRPPFELGSFDTIATYRGGKFGRAASFTVGWASDDGAIPRSISATFISQNGSPKAQRVVIKLAQDELKVDIGTEEANVTFTVTILSGKTNITAKKHTLQFKTPRDEKPFQLLDILRYYFNSYESATRRPKEIESMLLNREVVEALHSIVYRVTEQRPHATALAPLRTRPRRTYDEVNEEFKPEGDHIPVVLARLLDSKTLKNGDELKALMRFGTESGLFEGIDVKRLGKHASDPFQVRVKMTGPDANLVDVGYGVSQSLPIIIDSITAPNDEVILIQQPEVHLHPKAQAALGSFFVELAASTSKQFVIETHSDYFLDRIRIEVAQGKIPATQVQILYLERKGLNIKVHEIELDSSGNILNAPPSYRSFFLEEEMKLMSRASQ